LVDASGPILAAAVLLGAKTSFLSPEPIDKGRAMEATNWEEGTPMFMLRDEEL
jgi:hypothetical protein